MRTKLSQLLYHLGHLTYLIGMRYVYIPGSYSVYNYLMCESESLDVEGKVWGRKLPPPEKDDV